jgi:Tol biopolymer transport system component
VVASVAAAVAFVAGNGSQLTRPAHDPSGKGCVRSDVSAGGVCREVPAWSPDGKRVAFECETLSDVSRNPYLGRIRVMDANGSRVQAVERTSSPEVKDTAPSWSPDGKRIAFLCDLLAG